MKKNKYIAFLECNASGTGFQAIKIAQSKDYQVILLTKEKNFYYNLPDNPVLISDIVIEINTDCVASIINTLYSFNITGIIAFDDYRLITAAFVAQYLELPSPSIDGLLNCRFKNRTRSILKDIPGNIFFNQFSIYEENFNFEKIKYPCVVKPCDDSGSVGVRICKNRADIDSAINVLRNSRINKRGYRLSDYFLVEEYIDGLEYSAELFWNDLENHWELLGITRKIVTSGDFPVEKGHDFPWPLENLNNIKNYIINWLNALKLTRTVAHVEFKLTDSGPKLIEVNPRIAGDMIHYLCELSTDINLIDIYLSLWIKEYKLKSSWINSTKGAASIRFIMPSRNGKVINVDLRNSKIEDLKMINICPLPRIFNDISSSYDRIGYAIISGKNSLSTAINADELINKIEVIME